MPQIKIIRYNWNTNKKKFLSLIFHASYFSNLIHKNINNKTTFILIHNIISKIKYIYVGYDNKIKSLTQITFQLSQVKYIFYLL